MWDADKLHKPLVVIKLGGSALTDKSRIYTPRIPVIHAAAKQVREICKHFSIVLVHGAGSYGHIPVRKFGLEYGFKSSKQLKGLIATKFKLLEWESTLGEIFLKDGVPLITFLASDLVVTKNGRIVSSELRPMRSWLNLGCVPTTGGDIVPDTKNGFSILSGDQLAAFLAIRLRATKLVYGVDIDGIFDSNPKLDPNAQLLEVLTPSSAARLVAKASSGTIPDVTGGMAGKISEAIAAARHSIPVYFVDLTKDDRLRKVSLGQQVLCSRIMPP
jgi:isopentenyl phosphate kinase